MACIWRYGSCSRILKSRGLLVHRINYIFVPGKWWESVCMSKDEVLTFTLWWFMSLVRIWAITGVVITLYTSSSCDLTKRSSFLSSSGLKCVTARLSLKILNNDTASSLIFLFYKYVVTFYIVVSSVCCVRLCVVVYMSSHAPKVQIFGGKTPNTSGEPSFFRFFMQSYRAIYVMLTVSRAAKPMLWNSQAKYLGI